ncbi:MAG: hypothetical protein ACTSO2_13790 [Promethearchaeota archaeon]
MEKKDLPIYILIIQIAIACLISCGLCIPFIVFMKNEESALAIAYVIMFPIALTILNKRDSIKRLNIFYKILLGIGIIVLFIALFIIPSLNLLEDIFIVTIYFMLFLASIIIFKLSVKKTKKEVVINEA